MELIVGCAAMAPIGVHGRDSSLTGVRTVAQNAARNPGVVYRMGANSLIYNNRHENFSFFQKALDSAETYPYVLASRRRPHGWPAGPGAPGSTGRFDRLGP